MSYMYPKLVKDVEFTRWPHKTMKRIISLPNVPLDRSTMHLVITKTLPCAVHFHIFYKGPCVNSLSIPLETGQQILVTNRDQS